MSALTSLQALLMARGLDAYVVPRGDCFFGEEARACDERLAHISGFDGSAGTALVRATGSSLLLIDGRYTLQAAAQVDQDMWVVRDATLADVAEELAGLTIGYDPWLLTPHALKALADLTLQPIPENLVDAVWQDRPPPLATAVVKLPPELTGQTSAQKRTAILTATGQTPLLVTQPDALAWLLNQRGQDLAHSPVALAFGVLTAEGEVEVFSPEDRKGLLARVGQLGAQPIQYDPASTCQALVAALGEGGRAAPCPIRQAKAQKNSAEIAAMRAAHQIDGKALSAFLTWFDGQDKTALTELDLVERLRAFRQESNAYNGPSFATICGSGPNGAIVHYRVTPATNRQLADGDFIVLDSGGQYPGATTDVTRTLAVGTVTPAMVRAYTLVLRGLIQLTQQQFPAGTTGHQLDVLARAALWNAGLNYGHGTGHGVGAGLNVHEAPPNVSPRAAAPAAAWALAPGMIVSNEPGYYEEGAFGLRLENLLLVVERAPGWLGFETLTQVPFDTRLVDTALLTPPQISWLEAYQAACTV